MKKIGLFVACHEDIELPDSEFLIPIQVGCSLAPRCFDGMLHDDTGDNISCKNGMYCELTSQYWVLKNHLSDYDYVGFFHYRRFLNFGKDLKQDFHGNVVFDSAPDENALDLLGITNLGESTVSDYDVVAPRGRKIHFDKNIYEHYCYSVNHNKTDLDTAVSVLKKLYPEYSDSAERYLKGKTAYECNMYVMKSQVFEQYATWLFSVLFETEKQIDFSTYNKQSLRAMGYLGERLFGIWYTHNKDKLKTLEVQKTLFKKPVSRVSAAEKTQDSSLEEVGKVKEKRQSSLRVFVNSLKTVGVKGTVKKGIGLMRNKVRKIYMR